MGLQPPPYLSDQREELAAAKTISSTYSLSCDKGAVSLEPPSTAVFATVPGALKYNTSQSPIEKSANLHIPVSKRDEDNLVQRFCIQEGYGNHITGKDEFSIHYALSKSSESETYFSTYDKGTLDAFPQLEYDPLLWMLEDGLGKKLGDKHLYMAHSGINCFVEIVSVNGRWSEVLDATATHRSGKDWLAERAQEQDSKSFTLNEALLNTSDSHSIHSLSYADDEKKSQSEDSGSGSEDNAGASARAGATSSASTTSRSREFKCDIGGCNKAYFYRSHLNSHKRAHSIKEFTCPYCTLRYFYNGNVRRHIKKDHGDRAETTRVPQPHACTYPGCTSSYSRDSGLKRHIKATHERINRLESDGRASSV
ncbi:hypothetical protein V491_08861 [Pseudogymnoascus sp. VKM F-3775]|nr:hypothetical protein V491_08861 [Pseudogymnoascus sp. VKM F-3775]